MRGERARLRRPARRGAPSARPSTRTFGAPTRSASATSASTSTRTPTTRSTDHEPARRRRTATSWWWATTTSRSTRGAAPTSRNILEFERDYPEAVVVKLEQNYRSTARILMAANAVVANNANRKPKTLFTENAEGEKIVELPRERRARRGPLHRRARSSRSFAGGPRLHRLRGLLPHQRADAVLEDALLRAGVPYRIVGGTRFFDRAEIRDVIAYLKVVVNPADEISLKRIINTPSAASATRRSTASSSTRAERRRLRRRAAARHRGAAAGAHAARFGPSWICSTSCARWRAICATSSSWSSRAPG